MQRLPGERWGELQLDRPGLSRLDLFGDYDPVHAILEVHFFDSTTQGIAFEDPKREIVLARGPCLGAGVGDRDGDFWIFAGRLTYRRLAQLRLEFAFLLDGPVVRVVLHFSQPPTSGYKSERYEQCDADTFHFDFLLEVDRAESIALNLLNIKG